MGSEAYGLLTITPPVATSRGRALARDLVVLLDTSGSMEGEPLAQARRVVSALIESLADEDRLELIAFSTAPTRWKRGAVAATAAARRAALAWLAALRAGGGTEMRDGILEALRPLRADSQRQVVLVTDGLIGFESEVVGAIATRLPASSRVHTVGVGSAVNRSLTAAAARAGRGVEVLAGVGEDAEPAARRLVARTAAPLVVELALSGSALLGYAPTALPDLFAGAPARLSLRLRAEGGEVEVRGRTTEGTFREVVRVAPCASGEGRPAVLRLHAREAIEDLETRVAAGERGHDAEIERLGLTFQVATRLTSWIAVSEEPTVDPGAPTRRERMPQQLPHGMSVEGLGLRAGTAGPMPAMAIAGAPMRTRAMMIPASPPPPADGLFRAKRGLVGAGGGDSEGGSDEDEVLYDRGEVEEEPRRLRGRITLRSGDQLVVEIDVDGADLEWAPGAAVELTWPDGRRAPAALRQSTRPGTVPAGQTIRLVIELAASEGPPEEIRIEGASGTLIVVIS